MSAVDLAIPRLATEEGFRALPYVDSNNLGTIGYGFCYVRGITKYAAAALLKAQAEEAHASLMNYAWYVALDEPRQSVLLDLAFNGGISGLLHFPNLILALQAKDWGKAQQECHVSNPELASRYAALGQILLTGHE